MHLTNAAGFKALSVRRETGPSITAGTICQSFAYFEKDCEGKATVADNFTPKTCLLTLSALEPKVDLEMPVVQTGAQSVRMMCCKAAEGEIGGKGCMNMV
jgi:hypothetical protein